VTYLSVTDFFSGGAGLVSVLFCLCHRAAQFLLSDGILEGLRCAYVKDLWELLPKFVPNCMEVLLPTDGDESPFGGSEAS
jgi:hypothetical protein